MSLGIVRLWRARMQALLAVYRYLSALVARIVPRLAAPRLSAYPEVLVGIKQWPAESRSMVDSWNGAKGLFLGRTSAGRCGERRRGGFKESGSTPDD